MIYLAQTFLRICLGHIPAVKTTQVDRPGK
jgi:hypothetical protein